MFSLSILFFDRILIELTRHCVSFPFSLNLLQYTCVNAFISSFSTLLNRELERRTAFCGISSFLQPTRDRGVGKSMAIKARSTGNFSLLSPHHYHVLSPDYPLSCYLPRRIPEGKRTSQADDFAKRVGQRTYQRPETHHHARERR
jgi:hypothetical protein